MLGPLSAFQEGQDACWAANRNSWAWDQGPNPPPPPARIPLETEVRRPSLILGVMGGRVAR